jgi:YgiT-type zinc finger domain-containing protein
LLEKQVTYSVELDGKWIIVEHVPAKVCTQCGERLFAPGMVERLQRTAWEQRKPCRVLETPVFDFIEQAR